MSIRFRLSALRTGLARIHPVDKSLLLFMAVLLLQTAYRIFFQTETGPAASDIDVIVRTSSSAIFGYFLSANFINRSAASLPGASSSPAGLTTSVPAEVESGAP